MKDGCTSLSVESTGMNDPSLPFDPRESTNLQSQERELLRRRFEVTQPRTLDAAGLWCGIRSLSDLLLGARTSPQQAWHAQVFELDSLQRGAPLWELKAWENVAARLLEESRLQVLRELSSAESSIRAWCVASAHVPAWDDGTEPPQSSQRIAALQDNPQFVLDDLELLLEFDHLEVCYLFGNELRSGDVEAVPWLQHRELRCLDLSDNELERLPTNLVGHPTVTWLNLAYNRELTALGGEDARWAALRFLDVRHTSLDEDELRKFQRANPGVAIRR